MFGLPSLRVVFNFQFDHQTGWFCWTRLSHGWKFLRLEMNAILDSAVITMAIKCLSRACWFLIKLKLRLSFPSCSFYTLQKLVYTTLGWSDAINCLTSTFGPRTRCFTRSQWDIISAAIVSAMLATTHYLFRHCKLSETSVVRSALYRPLH